MLKFTIDKKDGKLYLLRAMPDPHKKGAYLLWYKEKGFFKKWQFVGDSGPWASVEQAIHYYFGFLSTVQRVV
jgi:hypothetical protein